MKTPIDVLANHVSAKIDAVAALHCHSVNPTLENKKRMYEAADVCLDTFYSLPEEYQQEIKAFNLRVTGDNKNA